MKYIQHNIETIAKNIKTTLNKLNIDGKVSIVNSGRCIQVENEEFSIDDHLYIWIRLTPSKINGYYKADISSVTLPLELRHKGVFTKLMTSLFNCKYIVELAVTSVCTQEMLNWCNKAKFESMNTYGYDGYNFIKIKSWYRKRLKK